ncbi:MAG TPA: serine--tRNA ligase [Rhizomicrobium sp.]|nr:serine--tRNA ligase [Rhizomicrobium sp.]
MHDIRIIRDDPDSFAKGLARRGVADAANVTAELVAQDKDLRALLTRLQEAQARRNEASKLIGRAKAQKNDVEANALMTEVAGLKDEIQAGEERERVLQAELRDRLAQLPNLPAAGVPDGADEAANVEVDARHWGRPSGNNAAKEHFEIGEALGLMDFERAVKVSGSRFVYLKAQLARLERALGNFMLDLQTGTFGYTEINPPLMVREDAFFGTGQMPKFEADAFWPLPGEFFPSDEFLEELAASADVLGLQMVLTLRFREQKKHRYGLIPTAEVPLTNYVREEILDEAKLPMRMTAWTPCFRAEAGAAGRDTRGMIRMHQFSKVELVSITTPEQSEPEHERMTDCAQEVLKRLDLAHRVMTLSTGDMGFTAKKTYDIEVWLPGQNRYREISSCSNCGDFQARRMNTRYRPSAEKSTRFVHTLNGSGLAVGRTLVAILENYQEADGSVRIPEALVPYMGGVTKIEKSV